MALTPLPKIDVRSAVILAILGFAALPLFWYGLLGLRVEWARPEFGYGPYVALAGTVLLVWRMRMPFRPVLPGSGRWVAVAGLLSALLIAALGSLARIDDAVFLAMLIWGFSLTWLWRGFRGALVLWPGFIVLGLSFPLPGFLYARIFDPLQALASGMGLEIIRIAGGQATRSGATLEFVSGIRDTAEATASLAALAPTLALAVVLGGLGLRPGWAAWMFGLAALPLIVVLTAFRVAALGLAPGAASLGPVAALTGPLAAFAVACAVSAGVLAIARAWTQEGHAPLRADAEPASGRGALLPGMIAALASVIVAAAFGLMPTRSEGSIERAPFSYYPPEIAGWSGTRSALSANVEFTLGADDYISASFFHPGERAPVDFFSAYYRDQNRDRGNIHSPEVCLPNDGWTIENLSAVTLSLDTKAFRTVQVNRAVISRGPVRHIALYWFEGRGRSMSDAVLWQTWTKIDLFRLGRADGAMVRVVTPLLADETEEAAEERLLRFLRASVDLLPRFIPR